MARVSIRGVAQRAGVSTMTVSRVLRGEGDSQYYEQVMAAVRELDYVPVRSAMQNRHIRTNTIGILMDGGFEFDSLIGQHTFAGMTKEAFASGFDLTLLQPKHNRPLEEQKIQVLDRRCDGFIFVVPFESPEVLQLLVKHKFPAVTCYSKDVPLGVHSVVPDNMAAVRHAVTLLQEKGHRRIALWCGNRGHSDACEREDAFKAVAQECGLEAQVCEFDGWRPELKLDFLLSRQITGVICHNDERALQLWDTAVARGMRIPRDLSIIGIDDIKSAAERGLTTFFNPFRIIGEEAVATMRALLRGSSEVQACKRVPMPLIERNSVAAPRDLGA